VQKHEFFSMISEGGHSLRCVRRFFTGCEIVLQAIFFSAEKPNLKDTIFCHFHICFYLNIRKLFKINK